MLLLVGVYIIAVNPASVDTILKSLGDLGATTFGTLQGRSVTTPGGVQLGGFQR